MGPWGSEGDTDVRGTGLLRARELAKARSGDRSRRKTPKATDRPPAGQMRFALGPRVHGVADVPIPVALGDHVRGTSSFGTRTVAVREEKAPPEGRAV